MNRYDFAPGNRIEWATRLSARHTETAGTAVISLIAADLPCPWCGEATSEADASCRGCGRNFG